MNAAILAFQLVSLSPQLSSVVYENVAAEVTRVELYEWHGDRPGPRHTVTYGSRRFIVSAHPSRTYVVIFLRTDNRYLIDGPFAWPDQETRREVAPRWHRTMSGALPSHTEASVKVELVRADTEQTAWPICFADDARIWSCWGVNDAHRGVVLVHDSGVRWWTLTGPAPPQELRPARWGRMLVITGATSETTPPRVTFARPVPPPPGRMRSIRLGTAPVAARSMPLGPTVIWIAGDEIPPKSWIEITSDSASTSYLALEEIAAAPPAIPVHVALRERQVLEGRVAGASGEVARGALITIFRLIDPPPSDRSQSLPRRVLATESIADDEGRFAVSALGEADYELVAWHAQLGRASLAISAMSTQLDIRLTPNGMARGRVVAAGRPVAGVDVISVPDPAAFSAAEDITDLKGGDTRTGPDGQFSVSLAPSGGGELRIGGGTYPVKRVPLPRPAVPLVDVGVIDLGRAIGIAIVLDRDIACDMRAAGPVGRSGLQLIAATNAGNGTFEVAIPEPGFWEFTLMCGQDARSLSPSIVQIGASDAGRQVRMIVR